MAVAKPSQPRSKKAVASLVFGLLVLVGLVLIPFAVLDVELSNISRWTMLDFSPLISIPTVIIGHVALRNIRKSAGGLSGRQFAVTGLVFGYLGLLWASLFTVMFIYYEIHPKIVGERWAPAEGLRTIASASYMYQATYDNGYPPSLDVLGPSNGGTANCNRAGLVDPAQATGEKGGYKFTFVGHTPDGKPPILSREAKKHGCTVPGFPAFSVTAAPISPSKNLPSYFVDQTNVIRMSKNGPATANSPPIE